jgi:hypothetical protein
LKAKVLMALSALSSTLVFNTPTGFGLTPDGKRGISFGKKGLADIVGVSCGIAIAVECKVGRDKLSEAQISFRSNWERCGGVFVEARDVRSCVEDLIWEVDLRMVDLRVSSLVPV